MDEFGKYDIGNVLPAISTSPKPIIDVAKKAQEGIENFKKDTTEYIQGTEFYKALDSIGRPDEDKGGIDGKPMRALPHNVYGAMELCTSNCIVHCPYGITFCKMDATPMPRIHGVGQKMNNAFLTINDHLPFINVFPYNLFTLCTNQLNPFVALATALATAAKAGVYTPTPWPCVASLPLFTFVPWIPTQFKVLRNGMPVVTNLSKLPCYLPALIEVVHCGQGLDDSWLKAMFMGGGGIDGLLNVLNIVSKGAGKAAKLTQAGSKANIIAHQVNNVSNFSQAGLNVMKGEWGDAIGNLGDTVSGLGDLADDLGMKGTKDFADKAKAGIDMVGALNAASEGDVAGMITNSLSASGIESADLINTYVDLGNDSVETLDYMVKTGETNDRELANQKVMLAANSTLSPQDASNFQDTLERNDKMQAEMEKKLPKQEAPEVEEPSKPYKTVPLEKTKKAESAPSSPPPTESTKKSSNPYADAMNYDLSTDDTLLTE